MSFSNSANSELLRSLLEPLFEDFQYWLERSRLLLDGQELSFITTEQHADLLARVIQAQQEVVAARSLFNATGWQVGVDTEVLTPWHQIIAECWAVARRARIEKSEESRSFE